MARAYTPKVNGHVTYYNAAGLPRPATITAVTSSTVVNLRISHPSTETHAAVSKSLDGSAPRASSWRPA
jgi:hypothetical protein